MMRLLLLALFSAISIVAVGQDKTEKQPPEKSPPKVMNLNTYYGTFPISPPPGPSAPAMRPYSDRKAVMTEIGKSLRPSYDYWSTTKDSDLEVPGFDNRTWAFNEGLKKLGAEGYRLATVTSNELGGAGQYLFVRESTNPTGVRPVYDYRRVGFGDFPNEPLDRVLNSFQSEGWEMVGMTHSKDGLPSWIFFMRVKTAE